MKAMSDIERIRFLEAFAGAWNRHDADALMSMMTDDCIFKSTAGPEVSGKVYKGQDEVRKAFAAVWTVIPDAHWGDPRHFVAADRGVSECVFTGARADGMRIESEGCDIFTFRGDKIQIKNSYRKQRTA